MKTIHIERLDLRCRGIPPASAHAALRELGPSLLRQLSDGDRAANNSTAGGVAATVRVAGGAPPAALADAMAAGVAAVVRTHTATPRQPEKS